MSKYKILDMACGSKMFWFDKNNENTFFADIRKETHILCDGRKLEIKPNVVMDFCDLAIKDNIFKLVVFDPPHLSKLGKNSWMAKKYGVLSNSWQDDLKKGFNEAIRVLKDKGILIFKWSEKDILVSEVLKIFGKKPLFGHTTGRSGHTKWICFMKGA